jgi:RNA polymerase sigma factor (sigma-70 family)
MSLFTGLVWPWQKMRARPLTLRRKRSLSWRNTRNRFESPKGSKPGSLLPLRREFLRKIRIHTAHPEVEFQPEEHEIPAIEPHALRSIDARTALAALATIEERYRSAVELFYLADLSYKEISVTLGVPIGTVMSRLSRGKEQLRRVLATTLESNSENILRLPNGGPNTRDEQRTSQRMSERVPP